MQVYITKHIRSKLEKLFSMLDDDFKFKTDAKTTDKLLRLAMIIGLEDLLCSESCEFMTESEYNELSDEYRECVFAILPDEYFSRKTINPKG